MQEKKAKTCMLVGAIESFRNHGIATTTLSEIITRSGAPRGSVYHYFPGGKDQLAGEAVEYYGNGISEAINSLPSGISPQEFVQILIEFFRTALETSNYEASCPVAAAAVEGSSTPLALAAAGRSFASWEQQVKNYLLSNNVNETNASQLATVVVACIEGATLMSKAQKTTAPLDNILPYLTKLVSNPY